MLKKNNRDWWIEADFKVGLPIYEDLNKITIERLEVRNMTFYNQEEFDFVFDAIEHYLEYLMDKAGYDKKQIVTKLHGRAYWNLINDLEYKGIHTQELSKKEKKK